MGKLAITALVATAVVFPLGGRFAQDAAAVRAVTTPKHYTLARSRPCLKKIGKLTPPENFFDAVFPAVQLVLRRGVLGQVFAVTFMTAKEARAYVAVARSSQRSRERMPVLRKGNAVISGQQMYPGRPNVTKTELRRVASCVK